VKIKIEREKPTRSSRIFPVFLGVAETIIGYFFFFFALIHGFKLITEQPQDSHNRQYNFYREKTFEKNSQYLSFICLEYIVQGRFFSIDMIDISLHEISTPNKLSPLYTAKS